MKNLRPERGGDLLKDTQRALAKGDLSLSSSVMSYPWLCPLPIVGPLGQATCGQMQCAKRFRTALPKLGVNWALMSLATVKALLLHAVGQ